MGEALETLLALLLLLLFAIFGGCILLVCLWSFN